MNPSGKRRPRPAAPVEPAPVDPLDAEAAARLPAELRLGTSSWAFPGWTGIVYAEKASREQLSRAGLTAYARHPLFRTAGVDRTHYAPLSAAQFRAHAEQVGSDFRFLVKAHEALTIHRYPDHPRYGRRRGAENEMFLDVDHAVRAVIEPMLEGLGEKAGPLVFQVAPQDLRPLGGAAAFIDRLHAFLGRLPRGPLYAVEVRNRELLGARYAAALQDAGAVSCLTALSRMPALPEQWRASAAAEGRALVVRWMVHRGHTYESAAEQYEPFDRLVEEDEETRRAIVNLAAAAARAGKPCYVIINNKAEGSAPLSVFRLARAIARELGDSPEAAGAPCR
ncbi:MAG: DUF72 domain-containing protein [Planctomycetes bacterium]|nr:DUF72 domain-containing protein [Planctomycetota bacterium]